MKIWFITGSQHLYGEEVLKKVADNTQYMVQKLNNTGTLPFELLWKPVVTCQEDITKMAEDANFDKECAGIITFMHTFSPSKMWINGLVTLKKPYCHLHTQFGREIPFGSIDMDFMNLYQSAHGDREHGFIGARLRKPRKIIVGYWENEEVVQQLADFMRVCAGVAECKNLKVARFGDNMREVAVTEGDKVEAQIKLGMSVNYYPVGDLVVYVNAVTAAEVDAEYECVSNAYQIKTDDIDSVKYQIKIELGMKKFLEKGNFAAFTTTFEDLHGLEQLPGMACQRLMGAGYGFSGEGDWKTAALTRIMKVMAQGLKGGTSFMEDYTYHLPMGNETVLGAHMLEVCPSIAENKPTVEVHPLGIGGKNPPARLKFNGKSGSAICVSIVDMGGRMRMICQDVEAMQPPKDMPKLPVASVMWKPLPNLQTAAGCWILAGGAHHTVMSYDLNVEHMRDFAELMEMEFIHISTHTDINEMKKELLWNDLAYKLK